MRKFLLFVLFTFFVLFAPSLALAQTCNTGDGNGDGKVDGFDYVLWWNNFNSNLSGPVNGNFNCSGSVDGFDYVVWWNNFGSGAATPTPPSGSGFTGISDGQTVSGGITVTYEADTAITAGVDFYVDNNFIRTEVSYPYALGGDSGVGNIHAYDTTQLSNGAHVLKVIVTKTNSQTYSDQLTFITSNGSTLPTNTPTPFNLSPTPTLPPSPGVSCSSLSGIERRFPCSQLKVGPMPENVSSGTDAWDMFTNILYPGLSDGDGINERFSAVSNPAGSGVVVKNQNVVADGEGHTTVGTGRSLPLGSTECSAFRWLWNSPSDLQQTSWVLVWQLQMSGSPIVAIEVDQSTGNWAFRTRNGSDTGLEIILTPIQWGHWTYFVTCTHLADAPDGWTKIWFKHDGWPNVSGPPAYQRSGHNTYQGQTGHNTVGIYAGGSGPAVYYGYFDRYGRAATPQRAIELAGNP